MCRVSIFCRSPGVAHNECRLEQPGPVTGTITERRLRDRRGVVHRERNGWQIRLNSGDRILPGIKLCYGEARWQYRRDQREAFHSMRLVPPASGWWLRLKRHCRSAGLLCGDLATQRRSRGGRTLAAILPPPQPAVLSSLRHVLPEHGTLVSI
jgi:hypothetical protein